MAVDGTVVHLRIEVTDPVPDVTFAVQRGRSEVFSPQRSAGAPLIFDIEVHAHAAVDGSTVRFTGPFTQGPASDRFIYISSGTLAGDEESPWTRRAKVLLAGITQDLLADAKRTPGSRLRASIPGRAGDDGPVCARVAPLGDGWVWETLDR